MLVLVMVLMFVGVIIMAMEVMAVGNDVYEAKSDEMLVMLDDSSGDGL